MPNNYRRELTNLSDAELLEKWCDINAPLSEYASQVLEEMERRSREVQKRSTIATEQYTRATLILIIVTALGIISGLGFQLWAACHAATAEVKLVHSSELDHPLTSSQQRLDSVPPSVKPDR